MKEAFVDGVLLDGSHRKIEWSWWKMARSQEL